MGHRKQTAKGKFSSHEVPGMNRAVLYSYSIMTNLKYKKYLVILNMTFQILILTVIQKASIDFPLFFLLVLYFIFCLLDPCPSFVWFCSPPPTAPSAPPQDVQLVSLSSTSLKVSWVAPPAASRHGAIVRYTVSYQALAGEDTDKHEVTGIGADATSHVLEGLEKWTEYQVWVRAHTDVGPGPESAPVRIRTKEDGRYTSLEAECSQTVFLSVACGSLWRLSFTLFRCYTTFSFVLLMNFEIMRWWSWQQGSPFLCFLLFPACCLWPLHLLWVKTDHSQASVLHHSGFTGFLSSFTVLRNESGPNLPLFHSVSFPFFSLVLFAVW